MVFVIARTVHILMEKVKKIDLYPADVIIFCLPIVRLNLAWVSQLPSINKWGESNEKQGENKTCLHFLADNSRSERYRTGPPQLTLEYPAKITNGEINALMCVNKVNNSPHFGWIDSKV